MLLDRISLNARTPLRMAEPFVRLASKAVPGPVGGELGRSGMTSLWVLSTHLLLGDPTWPSGSREP